MLIPDAECRLTIQIVRCLRKSNFEIYLVSKHNWVESKFLKDVKKFIHIPTYLTESEWLVEIEKVCKLNRIDILLPVYEDKVELVSRNQKRIAEFVHFLVPDLFGVKLTNDKILFDSLLDKINLPKPDSYLSEKEYYSFPIIMKPSIKHGGGRNIVKIKNIKDLEMRTNKLKNDEKYVLQKYLDGTVWGISVLCENGSILVHTIQQKLFKEKNDFSPAQFIGFSHQKEILILAQTIFKYLDWNGVAHMDLIYSETQNRFVIVEINSRYWTSLMASYKVGVNFPKFHCLLSSGLEFEAPSFIEETYSNNKMYFLLLLKKYFKKEKIILPSHNSLFDTLLDPLPEIYSFLVILLKRIFPMNNKWVRKFKINIFD